MLTEQHYVAGTPLRLTYGEANGGSAHDNGGVTYLFSNDVQFDIRAGYGLNDESDDVFIGSGLSVRFR
mgnify:CR=1 FL=1